jgi:hypothetical protein
MVAAGLGYIPPVAGALLQEAIDVAVIINALRSLGEGRHGRTRPAAADAPSVAPARDKDNCKA